MAKIEFTDADKRRIGDCGCRDCYCPGTLVEDKFDTGADGDTIGGRTPDTWDVKTTWDIDTGTWTIQGGKCRQSATNISGIHYQTAIECYQSGTAEHPVTITCDITIPQGTANISPGLCFRFSDVNNMFLLTPDVTATKTLYLLEFAAAVPTVRASAPITLVQGSTYHVQVVLNDTLISCTYGSAAVNYDGDANLLNTKHGLDDFFDQVNSMGTFSTFEDFKVTCA